MKKTLLPLMIAFAVIFANAQTKKIFIDSHVSGSALKFDLYKKQADSTYALYKSGTSTYQYNFDSLPAGIYRVHVEIGYTKYIPTWHPMQALWENAADINLNSTDSFACTQGLLANPSLSGPGSIAGSLTEGFLKTKGDPMKNIHVVLLNSTSQFVTMKNSDTTGAFSFTGLPTGTYKIRTDVVNTTDATPKTVVIDSSHLSSTVNITVNKAGTGYTGVNNQLMHSGRSDFRIYPNPSSSLLQIECTQQSPYAIFNVAGKQVTSGTTQASTTAINVSELPRGIYFLRMEGKTMKFILE